MKTAVAGPVQGMQSNSHKLKSTNKQRLIKKNRRRIGC